MPIDPDKLQQVLDRGDQLTKRFDAFAARRAKRDADKAQSKADRAKLKADQLDPAEALTAYTPPIKPDNCLEPYDYPYPAWYEDSSEREELRQGALSKERI